jgi:N-acetylglucosamine-6-sulfatase
MTYMRRSTAGQVATLAVALLVAVGLMTASVPVTVADAAASTRPNIVLVLTDDQTMESVAQMPYVSSRTDWISFDRSYINNGLCCPSRATILRGQYDTHTGVGNNAQGRNLDERETLPVWLRRSGYQTGLFGKYLNAYPFGRGNYVPAGWSEWQAAYNDGSQWGIYSQYHWKLNANGKPTSFLRAPSDYQVNVLAARTTSFIRAKVAARQPFYAMFTPSSTHDPWRGSPTRAGTLSNAPVPSQASFNVVADDQPAYLRGQSLLSRTQMDAERRREWEGAASVDDAVKKIDDTLRAAGVFTNTVMIFMTDNGYSFGNHRWERKRCEYNECARTPMLIRYPGLAGRHDGTHIISNVDIAATISELAGATPGVRQDGLSFLPLIRGETVPWRKSILLHWPGGDMQGLPGKPDSMPQFWGVLAETSDGGFWKYVELDTGERELYDETADPEELVNRVDEPEVAAVQAELQAALARLEADAIAGRPAPALRADRPVPGALGPDLD